jgi:hypothetical protein
MSKCLLTERISLSNNDKSVIQLGRNEVDNY